MIEASFPCTCRLADKDRAEGMEVQIHAAMERRGLSLVGWYHSHPNSQPDPSLRDIEQQMEYQLQLMGPNHSYNPCLGVIVGEYQLQLKTF